MSVNLADVRSALRGYAERGVFTAFSEEGTTRGKTTFRFRWHLNHEFCLEADEAGNRLVARNLLPNVTYPGELDRAVRRFVKSRADGSLPEHRRVNPGNAVVSCHNHRSRISLVMSVKDGDCLKMFLTLLNDLFSYLQMNQVIYLQEVFGLPEE